MNQYRVELDGAHFSLDRIDEHFVIPGNSSEILSTIKDAYESSRSIVVIYDSGSARFDTDASPTFIVRKLIYKGEEIQAGSSGVVPQLVFPWQQPNAAEARMARGIALSNAGDYREAHEQLRPVISGDGLSSDEKALTLKTDGGALMFGAYERLPAGSARDREFMAALADYKAWAELAPNDPNAAEKVAGALVALGDYADALMAYRDVLKKWPDESFWTLISIGAIHRTLGEPKEALADLDEIVKRNGAQNGMAYHYHRGWTLMNLKRYRDAIAEFDAGIKDQPDYVWAFADRACAEAALKQWDAAISDQKQVLDFLAQAAKAAPPANSDRQQIENPGAVLQLLQRAKDSAAAAGLEGLCDRYVGFGDVKRERSPLLAPQVKS